MRGGVAALASAGAASLGLWHRLFRAPLPRTRGSVAVKGVTAPVKIERDALGVARIEARTVEDLCFGQGFAIAQDRLFQLELYRRIAAGRVSEFAGPAGLGTDRMMRTLGLHRRAQAEVATMPRSAREYVEAYGAGIGAAITAMAVPPVELQLLRIDPEPWTVADTLAIGKIIALGFSTNMETELFRAELVQLIGAEKVARLEPQYPGGNPVVTQPGVPWSGDALELAAQIASVRHAVGLSLEPAGSNNWVVSGQRSVTGAPLLANDPHIPSSIPDVWHTVELSSPDLEMRGGAMPGFPGLVIGQSRHVAWGFTNVMADVQDLFVERVRSAHEDNPPAYEFEGEWRELTVLHDRIAVRGRQPAPLEIWETHHGPIVNRTLAADGEPLALAWTALRERWQAHLAVELGYARDGRELIERRASHTLPRMNLVWADSGGSIGYKLIGRLPLRRGGCPDLPKPGWTGEFEWEGTVPYEELPEVVDPESGYLVTANNRIVGDEYPHHITSEWLDGYRAKRIGELLLEKDKHDLDGFAEMQTDVLSLPGLEAARRLSRLRPPGQRERAAIERLRNWDGRLDTETVAGTIYQAFLLRLGREVARAAIGDRDLIERWLDRADNGFPPHITSPWRWHSHLMDLWAEGDEELIGRPWDELVLEALAGALDDLGDRFGPDPEGWRWGRVHELKFPHPLGDANPLFDRFLNRRLRAGGAQETVSQIAYDPNDPYKAVWAPSWRMLADPTDPDRSRWQMFTGQSGHPASPHYDDLQPDWLEGRTQPMRGEGPWSELELVLAG